MLYQDPMPGPGERDREFTETRLAEIRRLLDGEKPRARGVFAERVATVTA